MADTGVWLSLAAAVIVISGLFLGIVWRKGRSFSPGAVFHASRLSEGNHLFPTQVLITPTSVVQYKPRFVGRQEETIHVAHVASVKIDTGFLLSNVVIETTGGSDSIRCHGHRKADAARMKALIEQYQSDYYGKRNVAPIT